MIGFKMTLDLAGFISTHFQPTPSHGDPFQSKFWPSCQPYILIRTWFSGFLMIWSWFSGFLMILTNPKRCGTSIQSFSTHFRAEISVMCQKTKVSVLRKIFFHLKTWEWRSGRLPSANTSQKIDPFLPGCDAPAGCLRQTLHRKLILLEANSE